MKMKGEIISLETVLDEATCKYFWRISINMEEEPPFKLGDCEVTQCDFKQRVKEAIDKFEFSEWDEMDTFDIWAKRELKNKFGIL